VVQGSKNNQQHGSGSLGCDIHLVLGRGGGGQVYFLSGNEEGFLVLPIPIAAPSLGRESQQQCYYSCQTHSAHSGFLQFIFRMSDPHIPEVLTPSPLCLFAIWYVSLPC
jgi:hypothetical protein